MSMQGYAVAGSNYTRVLRDVLQSAASAQFNLNVFKFNEKITSVTDLPVSDLVLPDFYAGKDTPLTALVDRIASTPDHTAIVISDLVQSEGTRTRDTNSLIKSLARLAVKRPQIRLLAYRSNFVGFYFPEFKHVGKFHLALSQALPGTGRPFYLLVVAPSRSTMDRVDAHVLSRVPPIHIFNPTAPPVVVDSIDLRTDSGKPSTWGKYSPTQRKPGRIEAAFALHKKSDADSIALPLVVRVHWNEPLHEPGRLELDVTRAVWRGGSDFDAAEEVPMPLSASLTHNGEQLALDLTVRPPQSKYWDIYDIKMRGGEGNVDVPDWVSSWNTDDDSQGSNGNRTFQLTPLIDTMNRAITQHVVFCEYVVTIRRGA